MSFSNPQPLAMAAKLLRPATISEFRKLPYSAQGWKILDRWALNTPKELKALEQQDILDLLNRVLDQQRLETKVLSEALPISEGMAEHEILAQHAVNTEL
jgi:hypothetical protein